MVERKPIPKYFQDIVNSGRENDEKAVQTLALATEAAVRAATSSQPNLIAVGVCM